jgi:hypothetical protein
MTASATPEPGTPPAAPGDAGAVDSIGPAPGG